MGAYTATPSGGPTPVRSGTLALRCWSTVGAVVSAGDGDCNRAALAGDPVSLVLWVPSLPGGELTRAEFCRGLAGAVGRVGAELACAPMTGAGEGS